MRAITTENEGDNFVIALIFCNWGNIFLGRKLSPSKCKIGEKFVPIGTPTEMNSVKDAAIVSIRARNQSLFALMLQQQKTLLKPVRSTHEAGHKSDQDYNEEARAPLVSPREPKRSLPKDVSQITFKKRFKSAAELGLTL